MRKLANVARTVATYTARRPSSKIRLWPWGGWLSCPALTPIKIVITIIGKKGPMRHIGCFSGSGVGCSTASRCRRFAFVLGAQRDGHMIVLVYPVLDPTRIVVGAQPGGEPQRGIDARAVGRAVTTCPISPHRRPRSHWATGWLGPYQSSWSKSLPLRRTRTNGA